MEAGAWQRAPVFSKSMRRQPLFMKLRNRQRETEPAFNLEFNADNYAIATPEFWDAWRADKNSVRGRTISHQYALAKYSADQLGLSGKKPTWVVFANRAAKDAFEKRSEVSDPSENTSETLKGLGWSSKTSHTGMFFDDRNPKKQGVLVAWLNYRDNTYSVNVVHSAFKLTCPIPTSITDLGAAVDWVYNNSVWKPKSERRA